MCIGQDKFELNANPLGAIAVADIQSIQSSNALSFGENTSLSIRAKNRTLEVGDQKEMVAESVLFVLRRWLALRDPKKDASLAPSLSVPVSEMPIVLQKEVQRAFEEMSIESYVDLMQEPPFMFGWTEEARTLILADYTALFEIIFGADPSKGQENLEKYILLHSTWTAEIIIYLTNAGKLRRLCASPEPITHYLSDHFASISKIDLHSFDEIKGIPAIVSCLKRLAEDYFFVLPELILPTRIKSEDELETLIAQLRPAIPGISFDASAANVSTRELLTHGYLLHLRADRPSPSAPETATSRHSDASEAEFTAPSSMQTIDAGFITSLAELRSQASVQNPAPDSLPPQDAFGSLL